VLKLRNQKVIDRVETTLKTISKVGIIPVVMKDYKKIVSFHRKDCLLDFLKSIFVLEEKDLRCANGRLEQGIGAVAIRIGTDGGSSAAINKLKEVHRMQLSATFKELMKNMVIIYEVMSMRQ
jgi:hypothetical protein